MNDRRTENGAATREATPLAEELLRWLHGGGEDDGLALLVALQFAGDDGGPKACDAGKTLKTLLAGPAYAAGARGG